MTKRLISLILFCTIILAGCSEDRFTAVDPHQSFIASMNILQPALTFYDKNTKELATWTFEQAYTGATLIGYDSILLYGHQLSEADLYELSSGKKITTIGTGIGVTNAYYNGETEQLFITNSRTNELTSYTAKGKEQQTLKLRNYPMSMTSDGDNLYVINYKDTILSVVSMKELQLVEEWTISKSSHGIVVLPEQQTVWIGGHGEGSSPNQTVDVHKLTTGEKLQGIVMPLMPIGFAQSATEIAVVSHGGNELYVADKNGYVKWQTEVSANPFAVAYFNEYVVVAGYDDQTLYFIQQGQVMKQVQTGKGPFQLLVREG